VITAAADKLPDETTLGFASLVDCIRHMCFSLFSCCPACCCHNWFDTNYNVVTYTDFHYEGNTMHYTKLFISRTLRENVTCDRRASACVGSWNLHACFYSCCYVGCLVLSGGAVCADKISQGKSFFGKTLCANRRVSSDSDDEEEDRDGRTRLIKTQIGFRVFDIVYDALCLACRSR